MSKQLSSCLNSSTAGRTWQAGCWPVFKMIRGRGLPLGRASDGIGFARESFAGVLMVRSTTEYWLAGYFHSTSSLEMEGEGVQWSLLYLQFASWLGAAFHQLKRALHST